MSAEQRKNKGATVAELAAMLPVMMVVILGGTALVAGIGLFMDYKLKLSQAAQAGALVYMNAFQWQGAKRPLTDEQVDAVVHTAVQRCANQMGLGQVSEQIAVSLNPDADGVSYITVTVTASSLALLPLPSAVPANLAGVSSGVTFAYGNPNPIGLAYVVGGDTPNDPSTNPAANIGPGGVLVPAYGGGANYNPYPLTNSMLLAVPNSNYLEYYQTYGGYRPM